MKNVLEGVKVLDMSKVLAGPQCSMMLADLGADVIKIETPGNGDDTRGFGPWQEGLSAFYVSCNRNKRGITLNLKKKEALDVLYKMVETADVFIENALTGAAERLGVGYETLKAIRPDLIYVSISGYGRTGPYAKKGGYDLMAQAAGGIMSVTGLPGLEEPVRVGYSISDIGTGALAFAGILAALRYREQTGKGQKIDASLIQTQFNYASYFLPQYSITKKNPVPAGTKHPSMAPYQTFRTKDGKLIMGMSNEKQWQRFCTIPEFEALSKKTDYEGMANRVKNSVALAAEIEAVFTQRTTKEVVAWLDSFGIPNSPINTMKDLFEDEYYRNELMMDLTFPEQGTFTVSKFPINFSEIMPQVDRLPPMLGEHNQEVLSEYGYGAEDIAKLKEAGAI